MSDREGGEIEKREQMKKGDSQEEERQGGREEREMCKRRRVSYLSLSSLSLLILFSSLTFHASYSSSWGQGQPVKQKCLCLQVQETMQQVYIC